MPEADGDAKNFYTDVPHANDGFFLKGSGSLDWGMSHRLARVFRPQTGRTVMLAIDNGYFQGPTTGLERVDVSILPLVPLADALMCTRGILRSVVPPSMRTPVVMRASGGPSILKELSDEQIAIDIEDAARLNVAALAGQGFIGGGDETQSSHHLTALVDMGRNIFQSDNTEGMMRAVTAVVHERKSPQEALEIYRSHRAAPVGHSSTR